MSAGLARDGFDIDLLHGQLAENDVRRILLGCRVEVKHDSLAPFTGNVFVETRQLELR